VRPGGEADQGECVPGGRAPFGRPGPGIQQPVGHVVQHTLVLGQEILLEHEPDRRGAQRGQVLIGQRRDVQAGDPHRARAGPVQGAHQVQQGALARPGRAEHGDQFPAATVTLTPRSAVTGGALG
jgi:hypothetical protein